MLLHAKFKWQKTTTLCLKKNDTGVAHYNYDTHEGILIIFGRYVAREISN